MLSADPPELESGQRRPRVLVETVVEAGLVRCTCGFLIGDVASMARDRNRLQTICGGCHACTVCLDVANPAYLESLELVNLAELAAAELAR